MTDYLQRHGKQWRVRMRVPADLQHIVGKAQLIRPLHISDLKAANEAKRAVIAEFQGELAQARRVLVSGNPLEVAALRDRFRRLHEDGMEERIESRANEIADKHSARQGAEYEEVAMGWSTPLDHYVDAFIAFKGTYRQKTQGDFKRALGWLREWMSATRRSPFLDYIGRKEAGLFIDECLTRGRSRDKAKAYLGFLREYWRWLKMRHHVEENPWIDQELPSAPRPSRDATPDAGKRPYTDKEISALVYGDVEEHLRSPPSLYMGDLMRIAALSGMRLEEICQLRVGDCTEGNFMVREGKTDNAKRIVPIHSQLKETITRLTENRPATVFLIDGLPEVPKSRESRSDPASKAFTRYRRKVNVDERPNDKAKSNVDFHSFRRWFTKAAKDRFDAGSAGYSPWAIADVVGHSDQDIEKILQLTMRLYPGPSAAEARRAVVEAVKLPEA